MIIVMGTGDFIILTEGFGEKLTYRLYWFKRTPGVLEWSDDRWDLRDYLPKNWVAV